MITGWLPETLFIALPAAGLGIGFVLGRWDAAYSGYGVLDGALAETAVMVAEWEAIHHQADESYPQELSEAPRWHQYSDRPCWCGQVHGMPAPDDPDIVIQGGRYTRPPRPGDAETTGELFLADQLAQAADFRQWIDDWPPIGDVRAELFPGEDK